MKSVILTLIVCTALVTSACDSSTDPGSPSITVRSDPPDQTMGVRDTLTIDLTEYFSLQSGTIRYAATAESEHVSVLPEGNRLSIMATASGESSISITATAPDESTREASFEVTVLCEILPGLTESDYFPIDTGADRAYDFQSSHYDAADSERGDRELEFAGTLTWVVTEFSSECSTATFQITESFAGSYLERDMSSGAVLVEQDSSWSRVRPGTFENDLLLFDAYLAAFGGTFRRVRKSTESLRIPLETQEFDGVVNTSHTIILERNLGIAEFNESATAEGFEQRTSMTVIR